MREIKFRFAFQSGDIVFKYKTLDELLDCDFAQESMVECINDDLGIYGSEDVIDFELISKDQFTGITKDGVDIYRNDVFYIAGHGNCRIEIDIYEGVLLVDVEGCESPYIDSVAENDIGELLGNIHQNPELLESK